MKLSPNVTSSIIKAVVASMLRGGGGSDGSSGIAQSIFFFFLSPSCHCFPSNFQYFIDVHIFLFTSSSFFSENSGRTVNDENRWTDTPERAGGSKSARKMFGSIERGLDRVRLMLTPRRRQLQREMDPLSANSGGGPNIVSNKVGILFLFLIEKTTQVAS